MNNKRLFIKMANRTETNYTKCWDENSFSCSFERVCVCMSVSTSDLAKGRETKRRGGRARILMKP